MKVLLIGDVRRTRLRGWAGYLVRRKHDVTVLSTHPGFMDSVKLTEMDAGLTEKNKFLEFYRRLRFLILEIRLMLTGKYDIVNVQYFDVPLIGWIASFHKHSIISLWGGDFRGTKTNTDCSWIRKWALQGSATVTVVHSCMEDLIKQCAPDAKRIEIIPFGVNLSRFGKLRHAGSRIGSTQFCFIRPLERQFRPELALQAFFKVADRHTSASLVMIGTGEDHYVSELKRLVREAGLYRRIHFTGHVTEAELNAQFEQSDVFIDLAEWDVFGLVLLEAMCAGLPVITTWQGGVADIVMEEVTGFVVHPEALDELVSAMMRMIQEEELRLQMGRNARELVMKLYGFEMHAERMESLCKDLIKGRGSWTEQKGRK